MLLSFKLNAESELAMEYGFIQTLNLIIYVDTLNVFRSG